MVIACSANPMAAAPHNALLVNTPIWSSVFSCRSPEKTLLQMGVFTNKALWGAAAIGLALQAITIYVPPLRPIFKTAPLGFGDVAWVTMLAMIPFVLLEG